MCFSAHILSLPILHYRAAEIVALHLIFFRMGWGAKQSATNHSLKCFTTAAPSLAATCVPPHPVGLNCYFSLNGLIGDFALPPPLLFVFHCALSPHWHFAFAVSASADTLRLCFFEGRMCKVEENCRPTLILTSVFFYFSPQNQVKKLSSMKGFSWLNCVNLCQLYKKNAFIGVMLWLGLNFSCLFLLQSCILPDRMLSEHTHFLTLSKCQEVKHAIWSMCVLCDRCSDFSYYSSTFVYLRPVKSSTNSVRKLFGMLSRRCLINTQGELWGCAIQKQRLKHS